MQINMEPQIPSKILVIAKLMKANDLTLGTDCKG